MGDPRARCPSLQIQGANHRAASSIGDRFLQTNNHLGLLLVKSGKLTYAQFETVTVEEVRDAYRKIGSQNDDEVLCVGMQATREEIKRSYYRLAKIYRIVTSKRRCGN